MFVLLRNTGDGKFTSSLGTRRKKKKISIKIFNSIASYGEFLRDCLNFFAILFAIESDPEIKAISHATI